MTSSIEKNQAGLQLMSVYSLSVNNSPNVHLKKSNKYSWACFKGKGDHSMKFSWKCLLGKLRLKLFFVSSFNWHMASWLCLWFMNSVSQIPFLLYKLWFLDQPGVHQCNISGSKCLQVFIKRAKSAMGKPEYYYLQSIHYLFLSERIISQAAEERPPWSQT